MTTKKITKENITDILENIEIDVRDLINIQVFSSDELAEFLEMTVAESKELWGVDHDFALLFGDHPDYCFIRSDCKDIKETILSWLKEIKII